MTAQEELITGLNGVVLEAKRVAELLDDQGDWDVKRPTGWTPKEMYCHVAAVSGMIASTGAQLLTAPEDADFTASTNVTEMNARTVASMSGMSPDQLTQAIATNYGRVADWVKTLSDDELATRRSFAQMKMPLSDLLGNITVLHGHHHLFEAAIRTAF